MTKSNPKPPLIRINVGIFVGLPLVALLLVPAWGIYRGFDAAQWFGHWPSCTSMACR